MRKILRVAIAAIVAAAAAGCMRWEVQPVPQPGTADTAPKVVGTVRVGSRSERRVVLHNAYVVDDTLVGWRRDSVGTPQPVKLPREDVLFFEARRPDWLPNGMIALALAIVIHSASKFEQR